MNIARSRQKKAILIEGKFTEPYTPKSGRISSPSMYKELLWAKMCLSADADVTFKDESGISKTLSLSKGEHPFFVTEISVVSTGTVSIIHDGVLHTGYQY